MKVIGYYTHYGAGILDKYNVTLEEFKGSDCEWCIGIVNDSTIEDIPVDDILYETLQSNKTTIADYDNNTGIVRKMFETPIPVEVLREYVAHSIPIFEGTSKYLKLNEI